MFHYPTGFPSVLITTTSPEDGICIWISLNIVFIPLKHFGNLQISATYFLRHGPTNMFYGTSLDGRPGSGLFLHRNPQWKSVCGIIDANTEKANCFSWTLDSNQRLHFCMQQQTIIAAAEYSRLAAPLTSFYFNSLCNFSWDMVFYVESTQTTLSTTVWFTNPLDIRLKTQPKLSFRC